MDSIQNFQILWFVILFLLLLGYALLDGFDLGIGALLPLLARDKAEKDTLIAAIGPVWDGNEVWLITGGGALFAAFPHAYATAFSGFYPAMMLVLCALIFRAVSMEFRANDEARAGGWEKTLVAGSALAALLFGAASSLQGALSIVQAPVPSQFMLMLPYVVTILAVAGLVGRSRAPAADGQPYVKE
mgnify:CR=1 FL=1